MVETGLNRHDLGKLILAACFITDLGTVPALGGLVATYGWLLIVFVAESAVTVLLLPRLVGFAITRFGHRVSEPEIKLLVVLFGLGGLATQAGSEAVLPRKSPGWSWPGCSCTTGVLMDRLRSIAFAVATWTGGTCGAAAAGASLTVIVDHELSLWVNPKFPQAH